jgi:hypothetical protein
MTVTTATISHFNQLEAILDQSDIKQVVLMLARLCNEKAEHVRSNWQDDDLARVWEFNANKLASVEPRLQHTY